ncbi:Conserved_hypothetical protein [Hexamita inflata]|uniref:Uncharacterized protein n=1 Tax=Hexamita inflata TaxID=28002 RepID=A0AA86NHI2_9EUKA|nr:Conserved hypothetical protein [Hexamita inflata]
MVEMIKAVPMFENLQILDKIRKGQQVKQNELKECFTDWQIHCLVEPPAKKRMTLSIFKQPPFVSPVTIQQQQTQTVSIIPQTNPEAKKTQEDKYTEQDKKIAGLRLSRMGIQNYEEERELQKKFYNKKLPSVSTAQRYQKAELERVDFYDAHIGMEFNPEKDLSGIDVWKQTNQLDKETIIKAILQLDAVYVNRQVYFDENGIPHNTIFHKGVEKAISYIFAFVLVTECESESFPIFCQLSATGQCTQRQLDTYFIICKSLLKYNIQCEFLAHDCDAFYNRIEKYPFDVIQYNYAHFDNNPYKLIQDFAYPISKKQDKDGFYYLITICDTKHLVKLNRNVIQTFQLDQVSNFQDITLYILLK